ncbi:MAG: DUF1232 domain-containing protein [Gammaproteobacteria bacterium]
MGIKIEFELGEEDLQRFRAIFDEARQVAQAKSREEIIAAARRLVDPAAERKPEGFIRSRIEGLGKLVAMLEDDTWKLEPEDAERILNALAYFVNPNDLIPDQTPGLGILDDAIFAELVLRLHADEVEAYDEFVKYREAEKERRRLAGLPLDITTEDWLADKRAALHARFRSRRSADLGGLGDGWTVRGLGF